MIILLTEQWLQKHEQKILSLEQSQNTSQLSVIVPWLVASRQS